MAIDEERLTTTELETLAALSLAGDDVTIAGLGDLLDVDWDTADTRVGALEAKGVAVARERRMTGERAFLAETDRLDWFRARAILYSEPERPNALPYPRPETATDRRIEAGAFVVLIAALVGGIGYQGARVIPPETVAQAAVLLEWLPTF
ncbi:hypothetical protein [Rhodovibrio salinarum]|uniref:Uncharacterized protein n=1 Tax=Rhodovibrio salinarum TaxID=1087 RepID=A0A934V147_9PROT|nr:hypothetical protein [Rhodovibrio salinarum]MBK1699057.1 hypothetical protein [Rhodovibrio salinarum]